MYGDYHSIDQIISDDDFTLLSPIITLSKEMGIRFDREEWYYFLSRSLEIVVALNCNSRERKESKR